MGIAVICDVCGQEFNASARNNVSARIEAKTNGWLVADPDDALTASKDQKDYCPICSLKEIKND